MNHGLPLDGDEARHDPVTHAGQPIRSCRFVTKPTRCLSQMFAVCRADPKEMIVLDADAGWDLPLPGEPIERLLEPGCPAVLRKRHITNVHAA
jgi:hypothetical protein